MPIVSGSMNYSYSGRKRNKPRRGRSKNIVGREFNMSQEPFRRVQDNYPSADITRSAHNTAKVEKPKLSSNVTIAPAYNKGAYQVISKENVKDIGR